MLYLVKKEFTGYLSGILHRMFPGQNYELSSDEIKDLRRQLGQKNVLRADCPLNSMVSKSVFAGQRASEQKAAAREAIAKGYELKTACRVMVARALELQEQIPVKFKELHDAAKNAQKLCRAAGTEYPRDLDLSRLQPDTITGPVEPDEPKDDGDAEQPDDDAAKNE